jgi:hypothetical protein
MHTADVPPSPNLYFHIQIRKSKQRRTFVAGPRDHRAEHDKVLQVSQPLARLIQVQRTLRLALHGLLPALASL